jgi:regulatory protein
MDSEFEKKKKYYTKEAALIKLQSYCAYQERCHREVETKLRELSIWGDVADQIMAQLISDNFLNEERFAIAYAGGKYRIKYWGKVRIRQELKMKGISEYCINKAMKAVDDEGNYLELIRSLVLKKRQEFVGTEFEVNGKLANYLMRKGFESDIFWAIINEE